MSTDANYPLDTEWVSNPAICPEIVGFRDDFEGGLKHIIDTFQNSGYVDFTYQSLTQFDICISAKLPDLMWMLDAIEVHGVTVAIKGSEKHTSLIDLARVRIGDVAEKFCLLEGDAKVITYLLIQIGKKLETDKLVK